MFEARPPTNRPSPPDPWSEGKGKTRRVEAGAEGHCLQNRRPDGFIGTDLDLILRSNGVRTILIGGVATEGGIEGTARTARNLRLRHCGAEDCVGRATANCMSWL